MAQQSYPYDAGAGAAVNEAQWQSMARRFRQTGVIGGSLSQLAVSADGSALAVSVATGDAFVEGFFYRNDSALALTIAAANATNPRIDTVVVRMDRVANTAALAVVTGTAAASPVAPTLSQTDSLYELPLANVTVPAAAGVIVAANVTDRRTITQTFDSAAYVAKADALSTVDVASVGTVSNVNGTVLTLNIGTASEFNSKNVKVSATGVVSASDTAASALATVRVDISLDGGATWALGGQISFNTNVGLDRQTAAAVHAREGAATGQVQARITLLRSVGAQLNLDGAHLVGMAVTP